MRTERLLAAVVVAVGAATCLAAPAVAQTQEQINQAFLQEARNRGVPIKNDAQALELAHSICNLLNEGGSTNDALQLIQDEEKKWSEDDVLSFGGLAVYAFCKEHLPAPQE
jgi:Protein of unknown function (DUF732)